MELDWRWYTFEELTVEELYAILKLRQQVFVVEQQCAYLDCDDLDKRAWHLAGWLRTDQREEPVAYLRVITPDLPGEMPVIGRLLTSPEIRNKGNAGVILTLALNRIQEIYPESSVKISAQHYLLKFYLNFGFSPVSDIYEEDGIPHITMIRPPSKAHLKP